MVFLQILITLLIATGTVFLLLRIKDKDNSSKIFKIVSLVFAFTFIVRYMLGQEAVTHLDSALTSYVLNLENNVFDNKFFSIMALLLIWFNLCSVLVVSLYPFFKFKTQTNIVKFFCLPVSLLSVVFLSVYTKGIIGANAYTVFDARIIFITLELGLSLGYGIFTLITNFKLMSKKELLTFCVVVPLMLLAVMPSYIPQAFLGFAKTLVRVKDLSSIHRIVLYLSVIIPVCIYASLKGKDEDIIYYSMLFISLATLTTFSYGARFDRWLTPTDWPLHLCNTAMYIIPLCLIFKMRKLFYFTYFINVLGAFLAMAIPNYSSDINAQAYQIFYFFTNHYIAFFMPLLIVGLGIFKRPKLKEFKYSMIAFFVYFVLMVIINAWFTNYKADVDFFFINSDFIASKLGNWARNLRNFTLEFTLSDLKFVFYPVYQLIFFSVYVLLGLGMWFIYETLYTFTDRFEDIRQRKQKIKLDYLALCQNGETPNMEPIFKDGIGKLVIKDFKKKYASGKVLAVKGINLEIKEGEIFGFLGPNGAGKSTTIKCIVGIQGITEGNIYANGYDVINQEIMAKKQIGFVPDHYALYEKLTGREYINYIADIYGVSSEERNELIEKYVKLFELTESFDSAIRTYSHGMKQKIAIMSALVHNPKIWILDEPLTGLDPNSIYQVKNSMKEHAQKGNIVFFSSHIIDIVEKLCDRIAIIKKGEIVAVEKVEDIINSGVSLEEFYLEKINGTTSLENIENNEVVENDENEEKTNMVTQGENV